MRVSRPNMKLTLPTRPALAAFLPGMTQAARAVLPPPPPSTRARPSLRALTLLVTVAAVASACDGAGHAGAPAAPEPRASKDLWPERVSIGAATVAMGTATGTRRWSAGVGAFTITRFPVTNQQYQQCLEAGACEVPSLRDASCEQWPRPGEQGGMLQWPVACATPEESAAYCRWVGGTGLPNAEQWTLAARGPELRRFPWGNELPTCLQHASGYAVEGADCPDPGDIVIGARPGGASPLGVSDVLTYGAELLRPSATSGWSGCHSGRGCSVQSLVRGGIDAYLAVSLPSATGSEPVGEPLSAFRCVWE